MQVKEHAAAALSVFRVSLVCEAAPHIGCGPIATPVLAELAEQPGVREAWLNRKGTILGVRWAGEVADPDNVIRALDRHGIAGMELESNERRLAYEAFTGEAGWYRPKQLEELSAEEAQFIAARLVRRLQQKTPASGGHSGTSREGAGKGVRAGLRRRIGGAGRHRDPERAGGLRAAQSGSRSARSGSFQRL